MKTLSKISTFLLAIAILSLTGCATNRGIVGLKLPETITQSQANGKQIFIKSVIDKREFQENPKTQDIPSLGFGGAANSSEEIKKRAIARKRNSYGKALGDILLEEGQTVETVITDSLKRSFSEIGYQVIENENKIKHDTIIINATIQKFWAYMTPGFWAITLTSDISTKIIINEPSKDGMKTKEITVKSEGKYQVASGGNWMEIIHKSLQKYITEVKKLI